MSGKAFKQNRNKYLRQKKRAEEIQAFLNDINKLEDEEVYSGEDLEGNQYKATGRELKELYKLV